MIAKGELSPGARGMDIEDVLNQHAGVNGIDREDERSFDSSEHPKVIFNDQLDEEHDSDWYSGFRQSRRRRAYDRMAAEHRLEDVPSSEHPWGMTADEPPYPTHPYRGKGGDGLSWKPAKGDEPEHWARPVNTELPNRRSKDSRRRGAGRIDTLRQIVDSHQHQEVDGMLVDVQTANLLLKCYEGVSTDKARSAIETAPLERVVDMAWKVTKQGSRGRRPLGSGRQAAGRSLNDEMEFGRPISVGPNGEIGESDQYAPEAGYLNLDADGQSLDDEVEGLEGWELLKGFTGQQGYNGPVMHPSEFIGGGLERHIRENPGHYVAIPIDGLGPDSDGEPESVGWGVAYKPHISRRQAAGGGVKVVHNKMLGGWFVVRGPHQTPLSGRFDSKAEAEASLRRESRRQAADWGSYGEPQRGAECDNCGSDAIKDGVCRSCGEGGPRLSDPKKWPANVVNRESSRRQAKGVKCKECGKWLHDEVARAGHAHGPDGEVYDAEPQYGFESRGDYQKRTQAARGVPNDGYIRQRGSTWRMLPETINREGRARGRRPLGERRAAGVSEHTRRRQEWADAHPGEERGWANGGYSGTVDDALRAMSDDERDGVYSRHPWLETPRREAARSVTLIGGGNTHRPEGWEWDRHLSAFTAHQARLFSCSCGDELDMPGYRHCRCGKVWNGYAVASGGDTRTAHADTYLVREVPVRKDVILAGRRGAAVRNANRRLAGIDDGYWSGANEDGDCVACKGTGKGKDGEACWPCHGVGHNDTWADKSYNPREHPNSGNKGWDGVHRPGVSPWTPGGVVDRDKPRRRRRRSRRLAGEGDPQWYNDQVDSLGKKPTSQQKLDKARRDLKHWVGTNGGSYGKAQADKLKRLVKMYENDVARGERQAGRVKDQWMKDREDAGEDPQWTWPSEVGQDSPKVSQSPVDWHRRDSGGKWTPPGVPAKKGKLSMGAVSGAFPADQPFNKDKYRGLDWANLTEDDYDEIEEQLQNRDDHLWAHDPQRKGTGYGSTETMNESDEIGWALDDLRHTRWDAVGVSEDDPAFDGADDARRFADEVGLRMRGAAKGGGGAESLDDWVDRMFALDADGMIAEREKLLGDESDPDQQNKLNNLDQWIQEYGPEEWAKVDPDYDPDYDPDTESDGQA
jgi:hypothetical protein